MSSREYNLVNRIIASYPNANKVWSFTLENKREILIGVTTFLLSSQALLFSQISLKKVHGHSFSILITFLFELSKLFISLILMGFNLQSISFHTFRFKDSVLYAIPAFIYFINDHLLFIILSTIEPTTFEILANMRVITTSVLFRIVFHKSFHRIQWVALCLLCVGSATSQLVTCGDYIISNVPMSGFILVLIYCILSGCAGIYTEYLMKRQPSESFYLQNVQMYSWGVIINAVMFLFSSEGSSAGIGEEGLLTGLVVLNHALAGLAISAIIRFTDNIAKVYAHSMGMLLTMIVSAVIFWQVPSIQLLFGMTVVILSLYLFHTVNFEQLPEKFDSNA